MPAYELQSKNGINFWTIKKFEQFGIQAAFFQRSGGCSQGPFRSLNLAYNCGDEKTAVSENRARMMQVLGLSSNPLILCHQVHGTRIIHINSYSSALLHNQSGMEYKKADAMITQVSGLTLGIKTADCMPVLIADSQGKGIAAIHAGWRGLVDGILLKTISKLLKTFQITDKALYVALGPCIGPSRFEVSDQVLNRFKKCYPEAVVSLADSDHGMVDLKKIAIIQLLESGVFKERIINIPACTYSERNDYFSFRRDGGQTGRMLSIITKTD